MYNLCNDANWDCAASLLLFSIQELKFGVDDYIFRVVGLHLDLISPGSLLASLQRTLLSSHVLAAVGVKAGPGDGSGPEDGVDTGCHLGDVFARGHGNGDGEFATRLNFTWGNIAAGYFKLNITGGTTAVGELSA